MNQLHISKIKRRAAWRGVVLAVLLLLTSPIYWASAQSPAAGAAPTTTAPTSEIKNQPSTIPPTDPQAIAWLDKLQGRARSLHSLQASLRYDRIQRLQGDKQRRFGTLSYVTGPPKKFCVHFDRLVIERRQDDQSRWYIYDGTWLVEKLDNEKQFFKHQIVDPNAKADQPDRPDPLDLGEGPFAIPVTMNKNRILSLYKVELKPAAAGDPKDLETVHLHLTPLNPDHARFTEVDLWYIKSSLLPARARTIDDSENESIIDLTDVKADVDIDPKVFDTTAPDGGGWRVEIAPWKGN